MDGFIFLFLAYMLLMHALLYALFQKGKYIVFLSFIVTIIISIVYSIFYPDSGYLGFTYVYGLLTMIPLTVIILLRALYLIVVHFKEQ